MGVVIFGVLWVLPSSVKEILLRWHDTFVGKKWIKVWKEINRIAFENEELSIQRMKYSFICNFWS